MGIADFSRAFPGSSVGFKCIFYDRIILSSLYCAFCGFPQGMGNDSLDSPPTFFARIIVGSFEGSDAHHAMGLVAHCSEFFGNLLPKAIFGIGQNVIQGFAKLFCGGGTFVDVCGQHRSEQGCHVWGRIGRFFAQNGGDVDLVNLCRYFAWEYACEHVEHRRAERVEIGLNRDIAEDLLRRHIAESTGDGLAAVALLRMGHGTEVDEIHFVKLFVV